MWIRACVCLCVLAHLHLRTDTTENKKHTIFNLMENNPQKAVVLLRLKNFHLI